MARIREAQGDLDGALDLLHEAERLYKRDFFPNVHPVAALVTRVWIAQGRLGKALTWVREQGLEVSDNLSYLREFEHITLVRVLLARYKSDSTARSILEAMQLLERLLKASQEGERTGSVIEILVLQALAHQIQGNIPNALIALQQALRLAEPEGYVRIFVDEGLPMMVLLEEAAKRGISPNYIRQLLKAMGASKDRTPIKQSLIEPLSEREIEVLRLLRTDLSGPEIAQELIVSLNTVRTHIKNIYNKLGVNNRRTAVRRAEELDLF
jgi:LuxR family maltose regulon positive regulatory protein